jgi:tetratricopeptide (TPR) repeat protein
MLKELIDLFNQGKYEKVESLCKSVSKKYKNNFLFCKLIGLTNLKINNYDESIHFFEKSINIKKDDFEVYLNCAIAYINKEEFKKSLIYLKKSLQLNSENEFIFNSLGIVYSKLEKYDQAINFYYKAILINKNFNEANYNIGIVFQKLNQFDKSEKYLERIDLTNYCNPDVFLYLAFAKRKLKKNKESIKILNNLLLKKKLIDICYYNIGLAHQSSNDHQQAIKYFDQAIKIKSDYYQAHNSIGYSFYKIKNFEKALQFYKKAIEIRPKYLIAYDNIAIIFRQNGEIKKAIKFYKKALNIDKNFNAASFGLSMCYLQTCDFEKGWHYYQWRLDGKFLKKEFNSRFNKPKFSDLKIIKDKIVLVIYEQGLGDTIQFCRYLKLLLNFSAKVIFQVQKPLFEIVKSLDKNIDIVTEIGNDLQYDFYCPLLDLPKLFKTTKNSIPSFESYISVKNSYTAKWKKNIDTHKFNIGISWQGGQSTIDEGRSFPLSQFSNIAKLKNINLISLQQNFGVEQINEFKKTYPITDFGNLLDKERNFLDTAGIIKNVDLVITSCTAIAHLAGSMGAKVWIVLKYMPDWRWFLNRDTTDWYPSMKIYRQPKLYDWKSVFQNIEQELKIVTKQ